MTLCMVLLEQGARKYKIQCLRMHTLLGGKNIKKSEEVIISKRCLMPGSLEIYSDGVLYAEVLLESALEKNRCKGVRETGLNRGRS